MRTTPPHTPTPWTLEAESEKASDGSIEGYQILIPEINRLFFDTEWADPEDWEQSLTNAAHIVQCVNMHEELVAALKLATNELNAIRARDGAPQHIDWYGGRPLQTDSCTKEWWNELTDRCFAAIAKAEGVQP